MRKNLKIAIVLLVFVLSFISAHSYAASINMGLGANNVTASSNGDITAVSNEVVGSPIQDNTITSESNIVNDNLQAATQNIVDNNTEQSNTTPATTPSDSAIVSSVSSLPESELGLTNILNILLIAVGVILIFLAIAILIRLGKN